MRLDGDDDDGGGRGGGVGGLDVLDRRVQRHAVSAASDVHANGGLPNLEHEEEECESDDRLKDGELDDELLHPLGIHGLSTPTTRELVSMDSKKLVMHQMTAPASPAATSLGEDVGGDGAVLDLDWSVCSMSLKVKKGRAKKATSRCHHRTI